MNKKLACLALCMVLLVGCTTQETPGGNNTSVPAANPVQEQQPASATAGNGTQSGDIQRALHALAGYGTSRPIDEGFLQWACAEVDESFAATLADTLEGGVSGGGDFFFNLFGQTLYVLYDRYTDAAEANPYIHTLPDSDGPVTLAFTGDVNLDDTWYNMQVFHAQPDGIEGVISAPLLERMRDADILLVNNEFCFSERGDPMEGKLYTFRAATANVQLLQDMGADIVSLANNHVFDYGADAFADTLGTLAAAGIPYVGAGQDLAEAMQPQYFIAGGMKIAYVAASRAEKYVLTPAAKEDSPGVLWCYDDAQLLEAVQTARQNADWVVVYPHWGTENTTQLEAVQIELAHKLVDSGADIVVGAHPHVLQGIEFYNGKPIAYSLGNFWFNADRVDTALLEIELYAPGSCQVVVQPCLQTRGTVSLLEHSFERRSLFDLVERISEGIAIDGEGVVTPAT